MSRTKLGSLVAVLFVIVGGGIGYRTWYEPRMLSQQELRLAWVSGVRETLNTYDANHDAMHARDTLLRLRVVRDDQSTHLALVLAFQRVAENVADANGALVHARNTFDARTAN